MHHDIVDCLYATQLSFQLEYIRREHLHLHVVHVVLDELVHAVT